MTTGLTIHAVKLLMARSPSSKTVEKLARVGTGSVHCTCFFGMFLGMFLEIQNSQLEAKLCIVNMYVWAQNLIADFVIKMPLSIHETI